MGPVYAVVFGIGSQGNLVWSVSLQRFVTWDDTEVADYAIDLVQQGTSGRWIGDLPLALPAGIYPIEVYKQLGTIPDLAGEVQDIFRGEGKAASFGTPEDTPTPGLSQYALTTLNNQKAYQRVLTTASDSFFITLINAVSAKIERICGRQFLEREYRQWCGRGPSIVLEQYPVKSIDSMMVGRANALTLKYHATGAIRASVAVIPGRGAADTGDSAQIVDGIESPWTTTPEVPAGFLRLVSVDEHGTQSRSDFSFSTYRSTQDLADEINTQPGWTATLDFNVPTSDLYQWPEQTPLIKK